LAAEEKREQENEDNEDNVGNPKQDEKKTTKPEKLRLRDWLALTIAALQTILLPLVILLVFLFILAVIVGILF
jgi:hypothetical protein